MSGQGDTPGPPSPRAFAVVLLVCVCVYWPFLGSTGFSHTEGHRVIPGWEMMERGEYLLPRMFDQVYLRKPPGMPWAVALSSSILGQSEFAARAVSASAMTGLALLTALFAGRWFGRARGLAAGLGAALLPLFGASGRAAEIEALNNVATAAAVLLLIDLLVVWPGRRQRVVRVGLLACALGLAALAKGPAGFAAIGSAVLVACIVSRSLAPLAARGMWIAAALSAAGLTLLYIAVERAVEQSGQTPVVQGVSDFLWMGRGISVKGIADVAVMPAAALLSALPVTIALAFAWAPLKSQTAADDRARAAAQALALTCLLSLVMLGALGVSNPRYAMPSLVFVPVLVGFVARGATGWFSGRSGEIARVLLPRRGLPWVIVLLVLAVGYVGWYEQHRRQRTSGREAGEALAAYLPDGAVVRADWLIEARPEVLMYARRAAAAAGRDVTILWVPGLAGQGDLAGEGYLVLRQDERGDEVARYGNVAERLEVVARGRVHKFTFVLVRVRP
jgi:4-amino-4-deoxy-L-arabinose transferase-like glycosyltransferase